MTIEKLVCDVSTPSDIFDSVNGLVDVNIKKPVHQISLSNKLVTVAAGTITRGYMFMVPVEFTAVRICYNHIGGSGAAIGVKAIVSASDEIGDLSYANNSEGRKYASPFEGGLEVNTISARGWHDVTWGGAADTGAADAGVDKITSVWSDMIECPSRELLDDDGGRFAGYRPVLVRIFEGTGQFTRGSLGGFIDNYLGDCGARAIQGGYKFNDAVTTPSNWSNADGINQDNSATPSIAIEFYTNNGDAKSFISVGDSRFAIAAPSETATKEYNATQWLIEQKAILGGDKYSALPSARAGLTTLEYSDRALEILTQADTQINFGLYLAYSINSGIITREILDSAKYHLTRFIDQCTIYKITPVIITSFPQGTGYTAPQKELIDELEVFVAALKVRFLSPVIIYGDANGGWLPGFNEDADHMTPAGYNDLAQRIYDLMKTIS